MEFGVDDPNNNGDGRRKNRCLRHVGHPSELPKQGDQILGRDLKEANSLPGNRRRRREAADYRKHFK